MPGGSCQLVTDLLATRQTSWQEVVVVDFRKQRDTTDTMDFCPRQLVTDLLRGNVMCSAVRIVFFFISNRIKYWSIIRNFESNRIVFAVLKVGMLNSFFS